MNSTLKVALTIYLTAWVAAAGALAYAGARAGWSPVLTVAVVCLLFFIINGTLAYRVHSRRLRARDEAPPSFAAFLFQRHKPGLADPSSAVHVPALVRIAMAAALVLCGALMLTGAVVRLFDSNGMRTALLGGFLGLLGAAILYVGYRVFRMGNPTQPMFGPVGFRVTSYVVLALSCLVLYAALSERAYQMLLGAAFGFLLAIAIHRHARRLDGGGSSRVDPS